MSDIAGPPPPKPVSQQGMGTDRASRTSRDPQQSSNQATDDSGDKRSKSEHREPAHARDPAVSISATAAHLRVGEQLQEIVRTIDIEGRPIIETETATFALRPDAGLQPGDKVALQVVETGKQVAADLLIKNNLKIDPPIRLALIVISIHGVEAANASQPAKEAGPEVSYKAAKPTPTLNPSQTTVVSATETETLAALLSRASTSSAITPATLSDADNPDPLVKSNSKDLATLIAAQGSATQIKMGQPQTPPTPTATPSPTTILGLPAQNQTGAHILPSSELTSPIENAVEAALTAARGLGAPTMGVMTNGTQVTVQVMDISVSQVTPTEVAEVTSVKPLTNELARTIPAGLQSLGTGALSSVDTSKGTIVLPQSYAESLIGEIIRVSPFAVEQPADVREKPSPVQPTQNTYQARLTSAASQTSRQVNIAFAEATPAATVANANQQQTPIDAVHTARAFLTGEGPMNDLRLDTALGNLTVTLPAAVRPAAGDMVAIIQQPAANPGAPQMPVAEVQASSLTASSWPSFEQTYSILQAAAPALATGLASKSAQGGPKLLNSMMFLMAALKGGNPTSWIGDKVNQALSNRSNSLLQSLKEDVSKLLGGGEPTSEWRSFIIPFDARASDMPMIAALFSQTHTVDADGGQENAGDNDPHEDSQRFIVEADFSNIGTLQLEGLIRGKQFDLTLWSDRELPLGLTSDLSPLFGSALEANGYKGKLSFRQGEPFPVDVAAVLEDQLAA
jgi:hypothetical protein